MDTSKPRMGKKLRLVFVIVLLLLIVLGLVWWTRVGSDQYAKRATDKTTNPSEQAIVSMGSEQELRSKDSAAAAYEEQLKKKSSIKGKETSEKMLYYSYLVSAAIAAGKCPDAEAATKEFEEVDITSAFNQYLAVSRCYLVQGSEQDASRVKDYVKNNLDKLPEEQRQSLEGSLS